MKQLTLSLILTVLLVACGGPARQYPPLTSVTLQTDQSRQITVHADGDWLGTGITLRPGDEYDISARGSWTNSATICGYTGPDGSGAAFPCILDHMGYGFNGPGLIGKIGEGGRPFKVGSSYRVVANRAGTLYLRDYDGPNWYTDNAGSVSVTITKKAGASARLARREEIERLKQETALAKQRAELERQKAELEQRKREAELAKTVETEAAPAPSAAFSEELVQVAYARVAARLDDIAVIIGNADYGKLGKDIPNINPAYADAESFKRYVIEALGVKEGNIIDLRDATVAQLQRVFGSERRPKGQLFDWVRPGRSNITVYYAGHGAPGGADGSAYMVPVDADGARIEINGYPLSVFYKNLGMIPAKSITVVLEACFSGVAEGGAVISNASPVFLKPKATPIPANVTVISAGGPREMASWEQDKSHGLFTKYFLMGMSGEADAAPHGNGDGNVGYDELNRYLKETLTYYARRYYGRDQTAQIVVGQ